MAAIPITSATPSPTGQLAYRLAIPAAALLAFAVLAALWHSGARPAYFAALTQFGFEPFRFPFLDIHAVLAAAQCHRLGIDVYVYNPCDALGRVHVYSPLWLAITPGFLDTTMTMAVGLGLDLIWILSLVYVMRPASFGEGLILGLVALSPMTVYALERANCDLLIFLLVVGGCALCRAPRPWRFGAYALYLFAGLLKYYPLVLLVLILRERRRNAVIGAALAALIVLGLAGIDHAELRKALANVPVFSYFSDSFSARNLPFGIADSALVPYLRRTVGVLLFCALTALAVARMLRTRHLLNAAGLDPGQLEEQFLVVGALLLAACFFAGQNVAYRGVFFVLVMPGLVRLHRLADNRSVRRFLAQMIVAVLFVAWEEPLRDLLTRSVKAIPGAWRILLLSRIELLFWLGRELVWWWLVAGLAAIILGYASRLPGLSVPELLKALGRYGPAGPIRGDWIKPAARLP